MTLKPKLIPKSVVCKKDMTVARCSTTVASITVRDDETSEFGLGVIQRDLRELIININN